MAVDSGGSKNQAERNMLHLIWYLIVGFIAGLVAKSVMHLHLPLIWTIVLGIVGSVVAGFGTHLFIRPRGNSPFHPAGIIFSILDALLVLFLWTKLHLRV
jgi:uncharacterized membrane protein YeaQ/YmgE (transglycosylase-associated protein family)